MKISYNWLKRYVDLTVKPEVLADIFPKLGLEVESWHIHGVPPLEHVVVGEILTREQHPNADRLTVCKVNVGGETPLNIVCGAKNHAVGHRVFVALPGAVLPGNFKIKKGNLRGVPSEGMLCSASEIGLAVTSGGLLILEDRPEIGTPINQIFTEFDVIYDLAVTANRADALSHLGVARDVAAYLDLPLNVPVVNSSLNLKKEAQGLLKSLVVNSEKAPYYVLQGLESITVCESPAWLKKDLEALGLRPINNVVDITNWVMLETGQPLHAFDASKIEGLTLSVREATEGEAITTLDGKARVLSAGMLVIADAAKPLALAGIMGAVAAEVDNTTTCILLEGAYFEPNAVRETARRLGLATDSSHRFERDTDPQGVLYAMARAIDLLQAHATAKLEAAGWCHGQPPVGGHTITTTPQAIEAILGFSIDSAVLKSTFMRLGFSVNDAQAVWSIDIPSAKREVKGPEDLAEEFLRIQGTEVIPAARATLKASLREDAVINAAREQVSEALTGAGFIECIHYSLQSEATAARLSPEWARLKIENPLSIDQAFLRPSLIAGLLEAFVYNLNQGRDVRRLFEVGHVFVPTKNGVEESLSIAFMMAEEPRQRTWQSVDKVDFYKTRAQLEALLAKLGLCVELTDWAAINKHGVWQPGHAAEFLGNNFAAQVGLIGFNTLKDYGLETSLWAGEVIMPLTYFNKNQKRPVYKPLSVYPASVKDLAILVEAIKPAAKVVADVAAAAEVAVAGAFTVEAVEVFDCYTGEGVPAGQKSLAIALVFRAADRTLTDGEVNAAFMKIQASLKTQDYCLRL